MPCIWRRWANAVNGKLSLVAICWNGWLRFNIGSFERLAVIGDDEYRGFYIEIPRPEPEEWGDAEELIASGEYDSQKVFLVDWLAFNPMETRWFHVASSRYGDYRSIRVTDRKRLRFIITNRSKCADVEPNNAWRRENLTCLFDYL